MTSPTSLRKSRVSSFVNQRNHEASRTAHARRSLFLESLEDRAVPAGLIVDTVVDELDGNYGAGDLSLREAVSIAASGDQIQFSPALTGQTLNLSLGQIALNKNLTITGLGASNLAISGQDLSRIFSIGPGNTVTIAGLTIEHGKLPSVGGSNSGGAIHNRGTLTVSDSVFANNFVGDGGGAIAVGGGGSGATLVVNNSVFQNNFSGYAGGAISSDYYSTITVNNSTFTNNVSGSPEYNALHSGTVGFGGAILINFVGQLKISNSTFANNSAFSNGGAISSAEGTSVIVNSTFTGNSVVGMGGGAINGGGAIRNSGVLTLINSTIAGNSSFSTGGGISTNTSGGSGVTASAAIRNTIVAGNTLTGGVTPSDITGPVTANYSLLQSTSGTTLLSGSANNIIGLSPLLDSLRNNGGPTQTMGLLPGSPALDTGNVALAIGVDSLPLAFDQRGPGYPRTLNGQVDIGAFEGIVNLPPTITSTASPSVAENSTSVLTVTASDPDLPPQTVTFAITGGTDQAQFAITPQGQLTFITGKDFENPTDSNGDNVYLVEVTANDGMGGTATQLISVTVTDVAYDLKTSITSTPSGVVQAGSGTGNLTYEVTVQNVGATTAENIGVSEVLTLPAGTTIVSITPPSGSTYSPVNGAVGTWLISTLAPGSSVVLEAVLTVSGAAIHGTTVTNTATVTSAAENLINTADDTAQLSTTVEANDFGDAPDTYGTLLASGAVHHAVGLYLGSSRDAEINGQPTGLANGDDLNGDDEDGVILPGTLIPRVAATISVTASAAGFLDGWIDYNRNGAFDSTEQIATSLAVVAGTNSLSVVVPESAVAGVTYARFRLSSTGGLSSQGLAGDGEVEDYQTSIVAPAQGSATLVADPQNPGDTLLLVNGTGLPDAIVVQPVPGYPTQTQVVFPGRIAGIYSAGAYDRIEIFGNAGADSIAIDFSITTPVTVHGGDGNDSVVSGSGNDVIYGDAGIDSLVGGNGNDVLLGGNDADFLYGGLGNDLLIGGTGSDWLYGQDGEDILIGGTTTHDNDIAALDAIMLQWSSNDSFPNRVANLGSYLNAATVKSDGVVDYVSGNGGRDWFLDYQLQDLLLDYLAILGDRRN